MRISETGAGVLNALENRKWGYAQRACSNGPQSVERKGRCSHPVGPGAVLADAHVAERQVVAAVDLLEPRARLVRRVAVPTDSWES